MPEATLEDAAPEASSSVDEDVWPDVGSGKPVFTSCVGLVSSRYQKEETSVPQGLAGASAFPDDSSAL